MPLPVQLGPITERVRKFFRIRGRVQFALDEIIAPVTMIQDLTKGPYISGVTPAAGTARGASVALQDWSYAIILNDKPGSVTEVLGAQFNDRSFSFSWADIQNLTLAAAGVDELSLKVGKRSGVFAAGVPVLSEPFHVIQNGDGVRNVPVEIFFFNNADIAGGTIWRGSLGDNTNTPGRIRTFENIQPNITIGAGEALIFTGAQDAVEAGTTQLALRGFYQEQPS